MEVSYWSFFQHFNGLYFILSLLLNPDWQYPKKSCPGVCPSVNTKKRGCGGLSLFCQFGEFFLASFYCPKFSLVPFSPCFWGSVPYASNLSLHLSEEKILNVEWLHFTSNTFPAGGKKSPNSYDWLQVPLYLQHTVEYRASGFVWTDWLLFPWSWQRLLYTFVHMAVCQPRIFLSGCLFSFLFACMCKQGFVNTYASEIDSRWMASVWERRIFILKDQNRNLINSNKDGTEAPPQNNTAILW